MGDPAGPAPPWMDLQATARRAGAARWLDARLFEVLGGWVPTVPEPEVKIAVATHSAHHGWHASLWDERLPTLHDVDQASWIAAAPGVEAVIERIAAATDTVERLVGVHGVLLPRLSAAHAAHLTSASPVSDGPTIRTLRLVLQDELEDQRAGERLLQSLLRSPDAVERAARHHAAIESRLVEAGSLLG